MRRLRFTLSVVTLLLASFCVSADDFTPKPIDGHVTLTFSKRSDLSTNKEIAGRMGWDLAAVEAAKVDYTVADESFEVYIPADYAGDKPFGLFVYCSPSPSGKPPGHYLKALDRHHLIWIGPNKVGNDRIVRPRMGLAIDAALGAKTRFNIDPDRVYVGGVSGGGRVASMLGVGFADVFKGGFYIIGCNFYHQEKSAEQGGFYQRSYNVPPAKLYNLARKQSKHVFLTGDKDGNREQTELYYLGFKRDGFEHCTYFQVPGMGHQAPDADWFEKGLAALDEPLAPATKPTVVTTQKTTTRPTATTGSATQPADPQAVAAQLLSNAQLYADNKLYERAREKLAWIIRNYPDTPAAAEAKKIMKDLAGK